jgi:uncharacterized protein YacL
VNPRLMRLLRVLGGALGCLVGLTLADGARFFGSFEHPELFALAWVVAWTVVGFLIVPYLTVVPALRLVRAVQSISTDEFVAGVLGLVVGLVIGVLLGLPMASLPAPFGEWLPFAATLICGLGMMGLTAAKRADLARGLGSLGVVRTPEGEEPGGGARGFDGPPILVDTSAIIDGRIAEIAASGFLMGTLLVPRFVLEEVQHVADSPAPLRVIDEGGGPGEVDGLLVALAVQRHAAILTNDLNLNRVAELQGVRVLNVNALANAVKPALLPGEELRIRVIQEGREPGQGVGYLDDGTMIVVEGGSRFLERELEVSVVRVLQTVAGRMVFAQPVAE